MNRVVADLKTLFTETNNPSVVKRIEELYQTWGSDDSKCVTSIWTCSTLLTGVINSTLVVDAVESYKGYDKKDFSHHFAVFKKTGLSKEFIISNSMKFIRLLNSCIVDEGTFYNTEDRVTYRGVPEATISKQEVGQTFRVANWLCTSENSSTAEGFKKLNGTIIEFNIKKGCLNAGRINKFGISEYPGEAETLIPPYTVVKIVSKEYNGKYVTLDVAKDNKYHDFKMAITSS